MHLGLSVVLRIAVNQNVVTVSHGQRALAQSADISACSPGATALIVTAADPSLSLAGVWSLAYYRPELLDHIAEFYVLSVAPHHQRLTRLDQRSFVLETIDLPRRTHVFEALFRDEPLVVGQVLNLGSVSAEVLALDRGQPSRVRFETLRQSCLLSWNGQRLESHQLPPVGEMLELPHSPGLLGL